jgi:hypothetical protein
MGTVGGTEQPHGTVHVIRDSPRLKILFVFFSESYYLWNCLRRPERTKLIAPVKDRFCKTTPFQAMRSYW